MSKYKIPMGIEKPTPDNDIFAWLLSFSRDPETGKIEQWAKEIIEELDSYTEILPSGNTIAIFVKGVRFFPHGRRSLYRESGHERLPYMSVYDRDCDISITGHHLKGTPKKINERHDATIKLYYKYFKNQEAYNEHPQPKKYERKLKRKRKYITIGSPKLSDIINELKSDEDEFK
jgi:primase-polymerase (primpol)-like protein